MTTVRQQFQPPFDPTCMDSMRGCDDAYRAITTELRRINQDGTLHTTNQAYGAYLVGLKSEVKNKRRDLADQHEQERKGLFIRHLKTVLLERLPEAVVDECFRVAGARALGDESGNEQQRDIARRLKGVGAALPPIGGSGGVRRRMAER